MGQEEEAAEWLRMKHKMPHLVFDQSQTITQYMYMYNNGQSKQHPRRVPGESCSTFQFGVFLCIGGQLHRLELLSCLGHRVVWDGYLGRRRLTSRRRRFLPIVVGHDRWCLNEEWQLPRHCATLQVRRASGTSLSDGTTSA